MQTETPRASNLTQDIARGLEPVQVSLEGLSQGQVERLESFQYISDSVYGGQPIKDIQRDVFRLSRVANDDADRVDLAGLPDHDSAASDDSDDSLSLDEPWGCHCPPSGAAPAGDSNAICQPGALEGCDCIASFGHFYSPVSDESARQRLLIEALPSKLPLIECSDACACSSRCGNRPTQQGVHMPLSIRATLSGLGLFYTPSSPAEISLPSGIFISLYAGEYLSTSQARQRWAWQAEHPAGEGNYILSLRLPDEIIHIDPRYKGNIGRFLNHSCDPNCVIHVVRWGPDAVSRAAIFTKKAVRPGEELTFDYGDASGAGDFTPVCEDVKDDVERTPCLCGSAKCRGWMPYDPSL